MSLIYHFFLRILITLILFYQRFISPLKKPSCRFYPTCSHYAREAILAHGISYGLYLILMRLLRCHPFCQGGLDPVPTKNQPE
jgi:uncharacterized protein